MIRTCCRNLFSATLLSIVLIGGLSSVASAAGSPINIEVKTDVVELVKEVASWVRGIVARGDERERQQVANSVPRLVVLLTNLAGQKQSFADQIEAHLTETPYQEIVPPMTYMLQDRIRKMNLTLAEIQNVLKDLDPLWGAKHVNESELVFSTVNRKEMFLQEYRYPTPSEEYLPRARAADMAASFRAEGKRLLELAHEISNTSKEPPA